VPDDASEPERPSLRAEQVAQTRAALVAAGRQLFGDKGFSATSVDELARTARVTTGALYHHFPTKTALFEAVFEDTHGELLRTSEPTGPATDELDFLTQGLELYLDAIVRPDLQRILVLDGPAVLGLARFTELDERDAFPLIAGALSAAQAAGRLEVSDPETVARLILGTLTRAALLIANSPAPEATRAQVAATLRKMIAALAG
jgi:AcrR family transcriptional regulator